MLCLVSLDGVKFKELVYGLVFILSFQAGFYALNFNCSPVAVFTLSILWVKVSFLSMSTTPSLLPTSSPSSSSSLSSLLLLCVE